MYEKAKLPEPDQGGDVSCKPRCLGDFNSSIYQTLLESDSDTDIEPPQKCLKVL